MNNYGLQVSKDDLERDTTFGEIGNNILVVKDIELLRLNLECIPAFLHNDFGHYNEIVY